MHIHSWYSDDGEFSPAALVNMCAARGIAQMAVTDHNTVKGVPEALREARALGIDCVPGIEIDCELHGVNLHILGYHIDWQSEAFARIERDIHRQSADASLNMLQKVNALGFDVSAEEMRAAARGRYRPDHWTGEMFAEVLLAKPQYSAHPLLRPYRPGADRAENPFVSFYWDWFSQGKPCFVPIAYPGADAVIQTIHRHGGAAVVAHPGLALSGRADMIAQLSSLGIDGIEAQSSYHTDEQAAFYARIAKERGLFITRGSDFHGKTKPSVYLGKYPNLNPAAL